MDIYEISAHQRLSGFVHTNLAPMGSNRNSHKKTNGLEEDYWIKVLVEENAKKLWRC